ncbi:hypothetical protein F441_21305 [Phytophthora nicotianae CJ01A1]|uniref:DDE-1 domain-containing protein n=3 Tax=Phytophthora nicotianae TaxID=4792 RepID=V9E014_PHYNI|nr:hypothetical protein F443_21416 [Phytophthora nicotianae P1569]ETK72020.1 hypothetical protein L915_20819 [Phytophthora nicotianae]ETL25448.1 hypothetical protein L916_20702 [Phytophthora nicotianae]ETL78671.1 hypothetical protein L917_20559 [Phytophthora nicotianae]ETP01455.1 hypothetical protein F441_21305 [Phytophthora nicotianae CJ01A1]
MEYAAAMWNFLLMQQLYTAGAVPLSNKMVMTAALSSDLTLLKWIEATTPELFHRAESRAKQVAFDAAPDRGCLKSVKWLVETFPGAVWPLGLAAHGGNLEMVQWLHEHANFDGAQLPGDFDDVGDVLELFSNVFLVEDFAGGKTDLSRQV